MGKTIAFTSAALNYLPKVRKLCASIRHFHPEWEIALALADERSAEVDFSIEPIDHVLAVADLPIPDRTRWTYFHTVVELATAIKPFALIELLEREDVDRVLYFDPDMVLFSRLDDLVASLDDASIVLTPHLTTPESTLDGVRDNEISALKHGIYNLGFIGVRPTPEGMRFSRWWADRVYEFCVADIPNGLFTDQRWIDLAPAFFDGVGILKSPRFNVATWNLSTRRLSGGGDSGYLVDGEPLGFYHFTGFDSGAHRVMAGKYAVASPAVWSLIEWYAHETRFDDADPVAKLPWAYGAYGDGEAVPQAHRRIYRARPDLREAYPDPFASAGGRSLKAWMETQGAIEHPEHLQKKK